MYRFFSTSIVTLLLIGCATVDTQSGVSDRHRIVHSENHELAAKRLSTGKVTVVFEPGLGRSGDDFYEFEFVQSATDISEVIIYNRPGHSPSGPYVKSATLENQVIDLKAVIDSMASNDRLVLVGYSLGGIIVQAFTHEYPDRVSALVLVEPADVSSRNVDRDNRQAKELSSIENTFSTEQLPANPVYQELSEVHSSLDKMKVYGTLPDIPVIVLTGAATTNKRWIEAHSELGTGLTDFEHILVDAFHSLPKTHPSVVSEAISEIIKKINE